MRQLFIALVVLLSAETAFTQKTNAKIFVFGSEEKEKVSITKNDLVEFVKKWYWVSIDFTELKVEAHENTYFLLAKDETNKRTFAFRLSKKEGKFYLTPSPYVNIRTCDCMDVSFFIIQKGEIMACRKSKHSVVSGL